MLSFHVRVLKPIQKHDVTIIIIIIIIINLFSFNKKQHIYDSFLQPLRCHCFVVGKKGYCVHLSGQRP